jgi:UDP-glucose 4-epimerase
MRVIITGVAGFIGANVAQVMLQHGWEVTGIDDLSGGSQANVPDGVAFHYGDCTQDLQEVFDAAKPEAVVHLAAYAAEGLSHHIPVFNYHNNLVGTANVLNAAYRSGAKHFVFTSSIAAYGHPKADRPLRENDICEPCDPYGVAKLACEQHIRSVFEYYGGPTYTIFRPHNVFGPMQNISDPYRNVVGIFLRRALEGKSLPVFGDGSQTRSFTYVDSVARCIADACVNPQAKGEIFNAGGDESWTVLQLAEAVRSLMDTQSEVQFLPARNEVQHAHANHDKASRVFADQLSNPVSVVEGLQRTAEYVRQQAIAPPTPCPSPVEIPDRLPPSWRDTLGL